LFLFGAVGVRVILDPDRFVRHSPKGGEMLKTWNRDNMSLTGVALVVFAAYMLYQLLLR